MKGTMKNYRGLRPEIGMKGLAVIAVMLMGQVSYAQKSTPWVAPPDAMAAKNPLAGNAESIKTAKATYIQLCAPCHGEKGRGDGAAAVALNPKPADHSSKAVQSESDGSLFWKMTTGRGAMQSYKSSLTDAQRWGLVNYIRTLKKG